MTTALSLDEVKTRQQKTWSSGDYGKIAWITVPPSTRPRSLSRRPAAAAWWCQAGETRAASKERDTSHERLD
jgi:hypothetical protein